ncbi:MAG: hypothetical protein IJH94_01900 [Clostridia bacterium]|nr:hypothetical protein [Clostridia bacterium]
MCRNYKVAKTTAEKYTSNLKEIYSNYYNQSAYNTIGVAAADAIAEYYK